MEPKIRRYSRNCRKDQIILIKSSKIKEGGSTNTRISIWLENIQKMKNYNLNEMLFGSDFLHH